MSEAAVNAGGCAAVPGWFGKMPGLGDFVSRRLPDDFVQGWDDWLQRALEKARAELGADWLARYLVAPVRRFWLAPGVLGERAWAGVLMPSVDGVGRHFPLTVAAGLAGSSSALDAVLAAGDWFEAIDAAARKVLDMQFGADDLERELAQAARVPSAPAIDGAAQRLALALLSASPRPGSVWWCGRACEPSQFDCFAALPPAAAFAALLGASR